MKKMSTYLKKSKAKFLLTILVLLIATIVNAQNITTPYTGSFTFFAAPANIAFVVENTNATDIIINDVGHYCETAENNSVWELYFSSISLSGSSTVPGSDWTLVATSSPVPVAANGIVPVFNNLNFTVPANTQYRFVMKNTGPGSTRYVLTPTPSGNLFSDSLVGSIQVLSNVSCNGLSDGSATVSAIGGTGPYTYTWNTPDPKSGDLNNEIPAGTWTVLVTDANNCTATVEVTITEPDPLIAASSVENHVGCNGGADGSVTISAMGGTEPYTGTGTYNGLSEGVYTYTVTDANGCISTVSVTVTEPAELIVSSTDQVNVSCNEGSDGSVTITAIGGTTPYTGTGLHSGLSAGTHVFTVTDAQGCSSTISVLITEPSPLVAGSISQVNVSCHGLSDGSVTIIAVGGTSPYTGTGLQPGLVAGNYTYTVTDANGCSETTSVTITQPDPLVVTSASQMDVSCNGLIDGSVVINATGGTGPYTGTGLFDKLFAGPHVFTVTDANGCTATTTVTITQPDVLVASVASQTHVSCNGGNDGSVTITATGGTSPYTGDGVHTGLSAGPHEFIVTDANGCADTVSVTLTEPVPVTLDVVTTNVSCYGLADGTITADVPPGVDVTVNGQAPSAFYGPGVYNVVASVPNGTGTGFCIVSATVTLTEPIEVTISTTSTNVTCNGFANGTITATASPGAAITVNGQPYNPAANYGPGIYTVMASAANGNNDGFCTATTTVTITQPDPLTVSVATSNSTYWNANNGTASATSSGGTPTYGYFWSSGQTSASINNLAPGVYTVTITDSKNCTVSATVTITEPGFVCSGSSTHVKWGQGGWGGTPNGTNPATYLYANFAAAFPNGVTIGHPVGTPSGCNRSMRWTTEQAVTAFLPSTGTPRQLNTGHHTNFTAAQYGNTFASQVLALTLNVGFDAYDPNFSPGSTVAFGDMIVCINGNNTQFNGWTVKQLLAEGNRVLACGGNKNYISSLSSAIDAVNNNNNATCCPSAPAARTITGTTLPEETRLNIYPNPTNGKVKVEFQGEKEMETQIRVMDLRGRVVMTLNNEIGSSFIKELDLSQLENGMYLISIISQGQLIRSAKVSKVD